jgi:predicted RNase H-like nuclease
MSTAGAFFPATRVTGVDGCRDGWVGVDLDDGGSVTVRAAASLDELLAGTAARQVVGIDMPLLAGEGIVMPGDEALGRIAVDVLDAAAAAWSARRIAAGHARVLPDPPQADPTGRDIAISY